MPWPFGGRDGVRSGTRRSMPLRSPISSDRRRRRLRGAAALTLVLGVGAGVAGALAPSLVSDPTPRPVITGQATALPSAGAFGGAVFLFGRVDDPAADVGSRLDCALLDAEGARVAGPALSTAGLDGADRIVVDGLAVRPLLQVARDGAAVRCEEGAARLAGPLYLQAQAGADAMVPMAAFSLATLLCVLGLAGVVMLHPDES